MPATLIYTIIDLCLSGGINYLLEKQKVDALLTTALTEKRDVTSEELNTLKIERDRVSDEVNVLLDSVS